MNRNAMLPTVVTVALFALGTATYGFFEIGFAISALISAGFGIVVWLGRKWRYEILSKIDHQTEHLRAVSVLTRTLEGPPVFWSPHAIAPETLYLILHLLEEVSACRVLELGSGISTLYVANFFRLRGYGTIQSFDHDERWAKIATANLEARALGDHAKITEVALRNISFLNRTTVWYDLPKFDADEAFDFVIIDGPPSWHGDGLARLPALYELSKVMTENTVLVLDDADRAWEAEVARRWQEDFPRFHFRKIRVGRGLLVVSQSTAVFDLLP